MSETLALLRMSIVRSRLLLAVMVTAVLIGTCTAMVASTFEQDRLAVSVAIYSLFCALLPAALASIVLFDYSNEGDLNLPESGCSHWLLRMPVQSWKIALIPIVLRTVWVTALWVAFIFTADVLGLEAPIPVLTPILVFSAITIWVLNLSWRPFRSGWRRLVALCVAVPVLYLCLVGVFVAPEIRQTEWRPLATNVSILGAIILYASGVWLAIRSIELARTSITGIVPELGKTSDTNRISDDADQAKHFRSPRHALIAHDRLQSRLWLRRTFAVGVIPAILVFVLLIPLSLPTLILALIVFAYLGGIAISKMVTFAEGTRGLPPYLGAGPLSSATIAWARFVGPMAIAAGVYFCVLIVFAGWACWPENRDAWIQWSGLRTRELGSSDTLLIGLRWSMAIVIASSAFLLGRIASYFWFSMARRTWLSVLMSIMPWLLFLILLGFVIRWFLRQTTWESTRESAMTYTVYLPYIVLGLLAAKVSATTACAAALAMRKLASPNAIFKVMVIWAAITLLVASSVAALIPDPRATFLWSLALVAIAIPLARVLALPLSVAWSRHR